MCCSCCCGVCLVVFFFLFSVCFLLCRTHSWRRKLYQQENYLLRVDLLLISFFEEKNLIVFAEKKKRLRASLSIMVSSAKPVGPILIS